MTTSFEPIQTCPDCGAPLSNPYECDACPWRAPRQHSRAGIPGTPTAGDDGNGIAADGKQPENRRHTESSGVAPHRQPRTPPFRRGSAQDRCAPGSRPARWTTHGNAERQETGRNRDNMAADTSKYP